MSLLRPLMLDVVPSIQQTAALALGRLADHNDDLAEALVKEDILPQLVHSLAEKNVSTSGLVRAGLQVAQYDVCVCVCRETLQDRRVSPLNGRVRFGLTWQFAWGPLQNLRALYHESSHVLVFSLSPLRG